MLLTAYYNTAISLEASYDSELRSQRWIAMNVAGRIGQLLNDTRRTVAAGNQVSRCHRCIDDV